MGFVVICCGICCWTCWLFCFSCLLIVCFVALPVAGFAFLFVVDLSLFCCLGFACLILLRCGLRLFCLGLHCGFGFCEFG